jgi:hypothetical protein
MSTRKEKVAEAETKRNTPGEWFGKTIEEVKPIEKINEANTAIETSPNMDLAPKTEYKSAFSDMLAEQRQKAIQDKTDAAKMQKYYALTDALGALGKMGGTAIGGAIGGNMMDSAPIVADYQPSRGYLNAFEQAKQANERLRALDDKEFNFAINKQQRDEERAYQRKVMQNEREYKVKEKALDKQYQKEMIEYKAQLEQAIAQGNMELKAKLDSAIAAKQHEYNVALASLKGQYALNGKNLGLQISKTQANEYNRTPVKTKNGQIVNVPNNTMKSIETSLIGETINGVKVTKDNVAKVIMKNADEILPQWGISIPTATKASTTTPAQAVANSAYIEAQHTEPLVPKKKDEPKKKEDDKSSTEEIEGVYWD